MSGKSAFVSSASEFLKGTARDAVGRAMGQAGIAPAETKRNDMIFVGGMVLISIVMIVIAFSIYKCNKGIAIFLGIVFSALLLGTFMFGYESILKQKHYL
jgi:hypothetical protein